ncbi:hypothetical protein [Micromonospora sp. U21]|uniref:hypothetical protein n=1 Tax=Micromonospora sp. U21 TaxID=2824899 RepID=UPI001B385B44|nr:hypothetical protein [Micromonospora sp. U21]MBQ0904336.1 hypothetical protein [Micromonospora sp. U21]
MTLVKWRGVGRWLTSGALGLAVIAVTGACGGGGSESEADQSSMLAGAKRPFDLFLGEELGLIDWARIKLTDKCVASRGYPQVLQGALEKPYNPFYYLAADYDGLGPMTEEQARRSGFREDRPPTPTSVVSSDKNFDAVNERCLKEASKALGGAQETVNSYAMLGNDVYEAYRAEINELLEPQRAKIADCLEDKKFKFDRQGYVKEDDLTSFGLPPGRYEGGDNPLNWKPKRVPGTVEVSPPWPAQRYIPSQQESDLAVAMFRCSQEVGVRQAFDEKSTEIQRAIVGRYEARFAEMNPKIEQAARRATELVNQ